MEERRARWCALVFDGVPLGDHFTDAPHFEDMASLATVLVSCDVDYEIESLTRLVERQVVHTADFEALLRDGRTIRIELTQFTDSEAMCYQNHWDAVFDIVQEKRKRDSRLSDTLAGLAVVFVIPDGSPEYEVKEAAADEILAVLASIGRTTELRRAIKVSDTYPLLSSLGASFSITSRDEVVTRVQFRLPRSLSESIRILASVPVMMAKKAAKHEDYSDAGSIPVWLAVFARDQASGLNLAAIQELKRTAKDITVEPFERLMVANTVGGLFVDADRSHPAIYQSLSVSRCEMPRR